MVLGQKQEVCQQEKGPLAWPKDVVTGTAASARLLPQVLATAWKKAQCPYSVSQKSLVSHTPFVTAKNPTQCRIFASLH